MFTENQKMEELLNANPQLILMLPRFKMNLGFGEKKVCEVCKENNIPSSIFLTVCNVYTFDHYMPSESEIEKMDGNILIQYLRVSHDYYLNHRLKHIGKHIKKIADEAGEVGKLLQKFYDEYYEEVGKHFSSEEETLFHQIGTKEPTDIKNLQSKDIEETHVAIVDKLSDLINIIVKYLPPTLLTNERIGVWFDISQLSKDLNKHTAIEEKILIPYLKRKKEGAL